MSKTKTLCSHYSGQKILSLTRQGVISRDVESGKGKMPAGWMATNFLQGVIYYSVYLILMLPLDV